VQLSEEIKQVFSNFTQDGLNFSLIPSHFQSCAGAVQHFRLWLVFVHLFVLKTEGEIKV